MVKKIRKDGVVFMMTPEEISGNGTSLHNSECIAFLMDVPANVGRVMSYMHTGQHSEASPEYMDECTPATPEQYNYLKEELESRGYVLEICSDTDFFTF